MARAFSTIFLLALCVAAPAAAREWTTRDGRDLGEGKLLDAGADWASIRFADGRVERMPLAQLSLDDLQFVLQARDAASQPTTTLPPTTSLPTAPPATGDASRAPPTTPSGEPAPSVVAPAPEADAFLLTRPNSTTWQTRPDPPAFVWTDGAAAQAVSAKVISPSGSVQISLPEQPSPFAAVRSGEGSPVWDLWDLRTGQRSGSAHLDENRSNVTTVSADGKYLAASGRDGDATVNVCEFDTGRTKKVDDKGERSSVDRLMWLAGGRLLIVPAASSKPPRLFNAVTGATVELATSPRRGKPDEMWVSSPGGHFVANANPREGRIGIYDSRNGAFAGDVLLPELDGQSFRVQRLAFSADGAALLAWVESESRSGRARILQWRLEDGNLTADHLFTRTRLEMIGRSYGPAVPAGVFAELEPGKSWIIDGARLMDAASQRAAWSYLRAGQNRRMPILGLLGKGHMLMATQEGRRISLRVEPIPFEEIEKSRKIVAEGGTTEDLSLPEIAKAEASDVKRREEFPKSESSYEPALAPAFPDSLADKWRFSLTMVEKPTGSFSIVRFPSGAPQLAVGLAQLNENQVAALPEDAPERRLPFRLDVADLVEGERIRHWNLGSVREFLALSPSGDRALVRTTDDDRLDVWDIKSGKHVAGLRLVDRASGNYGRGIWGALVGEDRVLVHGGDGELAMWQLDPCRMAYSRVIEKSCNPVLTADGRFYALRVKDHVAIIAAAEGNIVASLPLGDLPELTTLASLSFSADGRRLLGLTGDPAGPSRLIEWDLSEQKILRDVQLPAPALAASWCGGDALVFGLSLTAISGDLDPPALNRGGYPYNLTGNEDDLSRQVAMRQRAMLQQRWGAVRYDLQNNDAVWSYILEGCTRLEGGPGDRTWFLRHTPNGGSDLISLGARSDEENALLSKAERPPRVEIRGEDIEINVDVAALPEYITRAEQRREEYRKSLTDHLRKTLSGQVFSAPSAGHLTLQAAIQERRGEDLPQSYPSRNGPRRGSGVLARLSLVDGDQRLWSIETWQSLGYPDYPGPVNPARAAAYIAAWDKAIDWGLTQSPPHDLQAADSLRGFGQSQLALREMKLIRKWIHGKEERVAASERQRSRARDRWRPPAR